MLWAASMKKPIGLSIDPLVWAAAKKRAKQLNMSTARLIENLLLNELARGGDFTIHQTQVRDISGDNVVLWGSSVENHTHTHSAPKRQRRKK